MWLKSSTPSLAGAGERKEALGGPGRECIAPPRRSTAPPSPSTVVPPFTMQREALTATIAHIGGAEEDSDEHALLGACADDDAGMVAVILDGGWDVNAQVTDDGAPLLLAAAYSEAEEVTRLLLERGANPNLCKGSSGTTALYIAAQVGAVGVVSLLIEANADVNIQRRTGSTALFVAAQNGHEEVVMLLIEAGADVHRARNDGTTALYIAAQEGHCTIVRAVLSAGANVDVQRDSRATPLFIAVQEGRADVVAALLEAGANPSRCRSDGTGPLYVAAQSGNLDVMQLLLQHGARHGATSIQDGSTPLYVAAQEGHAAAVKILLDAGASPSVSLIATNSTPLFAASARGHIEVVQVLLAAGANVNAKTKDGATPLRIAAVVKDPVVMQELAKAGGNMGGSFINVSLPESVGASDETIRRVQKASSESSMLTVPGTPPIGRQRSDDQEVLDSPVRRMVSEDEGVRVGGENRALRRQKASTNLGHSSIFTMSGCTELSQERRTSDGELLAKTSVIVASRRRKSKKKKKSSKGGADDKSKTSSSRSVCPSCGRSEQPVHKCVMCSRKLCGSCNSIRVSYPQQYGFTVPKKACCYCLPVLMHMRHNLASSSLNTTALDNIRVSRLTDKGFLTAGLPEITATGKALGQMSKLLFSLSGMNKEEQKFSQKTADFITGMKYSTKFNADLKITLPVPQKWPSEEERDEASIRDTIRQQKPFDQHGESIELLLYKPRDVEGPYPVLVWFHGGGFCLNRASDQPYQALCCYIAAQTKCVVVSVDYRRAPAHKFPTQAEDAYAAWLWVTEVGEGFDFDLNRIAVAGDSAGGTLAAVTCLMAVDRYALIPCHQVLYYPCLTDPTTTDLQSHRDYSAGPVLPRDVLAWCMKCLFESMDQLQEQYAMPLKRADMSRIPPCAIINAMHDPLADHGLLYFNKLKQSGIPVSRTVYRRSIHGFIALMDVDQEAEEAVMEMCMILRMVFGLESKSRLERSMAVVRMMHAAKSGGSSGDL